MNSLICLSFVTAIFSGILVYIAGLIGLIGWVGFAGCTTYFSAGGGKNGIKLALQTNISGALWATFAVIISGFISDGFIEICITCIVTFILCIQSKFKKLSFIPGAFIGCFSVFAIGENFLSILISLIAGVILGYLCDLCGKSLFEFIKNKGGKFYGRNRCN